MKNRVLFMFVITMALLGSSWLAAPSARGATTPAVAVEMNAPPPTVDCCLPPCPPICPEVTPLTELLRRLNSANALGSRSRGRSL